MGCVLSLLPTTTNVKSSTACVKIAFYVMVAISYQRVDGITFFLILHGVFMLHLHAAEYAVFDDWMSWSDLKS